MGSMGQTFLLMDTASYEYSSSTWGDLLTSFNGNAITYDALGNPINYYNGATFEWLARRLVGATYNGKQMSFTYNDNGIRTSKTVGNVTTNYYWSGSMLIAEETAGNMTVYLYDANGELLGFRYRESTYAEGTWDSYFFEKNLQGDIIAVYNLAGTKLVSYTYDAWGNFTTTYHNGGNLTTATKNNFRYRSYYYDTDLGLYYLMSRYYDSNTGRFINVDSYVSTGQGIIGNNMYAYCGNNPIMRSDRGGAARGYESLDQDGKSMLEDPYFGIDSAYYNYQVYSKTAAYDARLGGYYYSGGGSIGGYTSNFAIGGYVSVDDTQIKQSEHKSLRNSRTKPQVLSDPKLIENQKALREIKNEIRKNARIGKMVSYREIQIFDEWCKEYNIPQHHQAYIGSGAHWQTGYDHTHYYGQHVPFK